VGWATEKSWLDSWHGEELFVFFTVYRLHPASYSVGIKGKVMDVKLTTHLPSRAKVDDNDACNYTSSAPF
jgi:hypothetical protein